MFSFPFRFSFFFSFLSSISLFYSFSYSFFVLILIFLYITVSCRFSASFTSSFHCYLLHCSDPFHSFYSPSISLLFPPSASHPREPSLTGYCTRHFLTVSMTLFECLISFQSFQTTCWFSSLSFPLFLSLFLPLLSHYLPSYCFSFSFSLSSFLPHQFLRVELHVNEDIERETTSERKITAENVENVYFFLFSLRLDIDWGWN